MATADESPKTEKTSRSTKQAAQADTQPEQTAPENPAGPASKPEPLALPKGALIGMRTRESTSSEVSEVIVYPDGRVTHDARDKPDMRRPRLLTDAKIAEIRHTLEKIDFFRMSSAASQQNGNTVQIAARIHARTNSVEYAKENLPPSLAPLIEQLSALLPQAHPEQVSESSEKA